jgi:hypothetical protein
VAFGAPASPAPDLIPGEYPEGNGYGTLTIGLKADAKLVGKLADGTAYTSSSFVCPPVGSATEDTVPVYASFATATGSLVGEALVEAGVVDSASAFRWFKKENAGQYYPYGVANGATTGLSIDIVAGGTRTAATTPTVVAGTSTVSFTGGSLDTFGDALFDVNNLVVTTTNPKLTFNATTKLLTGTYTAAGKINTIAGIVVGTTTYGYILTPLPLHTDGTGEGGLVTLVPVPAP